MALTNKQALFVEYYAVHLNATRAAIQAGYSEKTARSIGSENLKKPEIQQAVSRALVERTSRLGADADKVVQELSYIAFFSIADVVNISPEGEITPAPLSEWTVETLRALDRVQVKYCKEGPDAGKIEKFSVRPHKKMKALELLFKMHEASKKFG